MITEPELFDLCEQVAVFLRAKGLDDVVIPLVFGAGFCACLVDFPKDLRNQIVKIQRQQLEATLRMTN